MEMYEAGKECALRGGCFQENPYFIKNDNDSGSYIQWVRGFMDYYTVEPACVDCQGTGELQLDARKSGYAIVILKCSCNKPPLKYT